MAQYAINVHASFTFMPRNDDFGGEATLLMKLKYESPYTNTVKEREDYVIKGQLNDMLLREAKELLMDGSTIQGWGQQLMHRFLDLDWKETHPEENPAIKEIIELAQATKHEFQVVVTRDEY